MFPASPSHATDAQLSQMAKGGLPNAVNEEITRLALRRGARAVPQQPVPLPQRKMSGEEMIDDFVRRVRQENANAANSIVPAGTPMPQQPQQPQPQPAQASGIAGYQSGGVRGFQDGGGNEPVSRLTRSQDFGWHPDQAPLSALDKIRSGPSVRDGYLRYPEGRETDGYYSGPQPFKKNIPNGRYFAPGHMVDKMPSPQNKDYRGPPQPSKRPRDPDYQRLVDLSQGRIGNIYDGWTEMEGHHGRPDDAAMAPTLPADEAASVEASTGIAALMADAPQLGAFKPSAYVKPEGYVETDLIDINQAGNDRVAANRGRIDALASPYNEGAAELEGMSEEIKRAGFFNAITKAGLAAIQGSSAGFDPRNGDFMAAAGDFIGAYVESFEGDAKRQQELKEKIIAYKGAANKLTFNAENTMFSQGADIAQAQNQQQITENSFRNAYNRGVAADENNYNLNRDTLLLQERELNMKANLEKWKASIEIELSKQKGLSLEDAGKLSSEATKAWQDAYNATIEALTKSEDTVTDSMLEQAQAAGYAAATQYISQTVDFYHGEFGYNPGGGIAELTQRTANRRMGEVPAVGTEGEQGTPHKTMPFRPLPQTGSGAGIKDYGPGVLGGR